MEWIVNLCSFLGAWLLVAGPVLQASNELREAGVEAHAQDGRLPSLWWWLVPTAMYGLSQRNLRDEAQQTRRFRRVATGWYMVGIGGLLIAVKETWELGEFAGWSIPARIGVFGAAFGAVWLATSLRMIIQSLQDRSR